MQTKREKLLAKHAKYNASSKGQKRNRRYEEKHPERKQRWAVLEACRERLI